MLSIDDIEYEDHPAFAGCRFSDDEASTALAHELDRALEDASRQVLNPHMDPQRIFAATIQAASRRLFDHLRRSNTDLPDFKAFADELEQEMLRVAEQDLSISVRQAVHVRYPTDAVAGMIHDSLNRHGYWLGRLGTAALEQLRQVLAPYQQELLLRYKRDGKRDRDSLSMNDWPEATFQEMVKVFNAPSILIALSNFKGNYVTFTGVALELSVPGQAWSKGRYDPGLESPVTEYFHVDQSIAHPKMIYYLTDVGPENGPTMVLPFRFTRLKSLTGRSLDAVHFGGRREANSNNSVIGSKDGRQAFARLPKAMRAMGHFGNDILAGSWQEKEAQECRVSVLGPAGSCVLFDGGRVAHKGGVVREDIRFALQVIYSPLE